MPHPAAIGQGVQCDLQRFNRRFNPRTRPARCTHFFPHTHNHWRTRRSERFADRRVPGDGIAEGLSTDFLGLYHRGDETGGSRRVAVAGRKTGSRLVAGALCCAGGSES
jgi:hypothetical protein